MRAEAPRRERYDAEPQPLGVGYLCSITNPDQNSWGGWKNPDCAVWAGALNQADLAALLRYVAGLPWTYAGAVQNLLLDQREAYFGLYMFRDGELRQYAPPPPGDANDQHAWWLKQSAGSRANRHSFPVARRHWTSHRNQGNLSSWASTW